MRLRVGAVAAGVAFAVAVGGCAQDDLSAARRADLAETDAPGGPGGADLASPSGDGSANVPDGGDAPDQAMPPPDLRAPPVDLSCSGGGLVLAPGMIAFGGVAIGMVAAPQNVTIANTGMAPIDILYVSLTGPNSNQFKFNDPGAFTLNGCQSRTVAVMYAPVAKGAHMAALVVTPKGGAGVQVRLSGTGL